MSTDTIVVLVLGVFLLLLVIETPVAFALAAAGGAGIMLLRNVDQSVSTLGSEPFVATANYSWAIIPMYILLGMFALHGRLAGRMFKVASIVFRRFPGGLGVATVGACAGFAAVSGSSLATAASIGKLAVIEMRRYGYPAHLASGIVACAGTLGILIPPSVVLALYAVLSGESVARVLVAGIVPGIIFATAMAGYVIMRARSVMGGPERLEPALAGAAGHETGSGATGSSTGGASTAVETGQHDGGAPDTAPSSGDLSTETRSDVDTATRWQLIRSVLWAVAIFVVILVGVFTGLFTPIESAAIGALLALIMLVAENVASGLRLLYERWKASLMEAAAVTSMAFGLLIGASILSTFLVLARVPMNFATWIGTLDVPPILVVIGTLLLLVPIGMFLEGLSILIIVVPLVHPVITDLGYDGAWFAILFVIILEIGLITPPVGMNAFVVSITSGIKLETVFRGIVPFVLVGLAVVALLILVPDLVTWLPSMVVE